MCVYQWIIQQRSHTEGGAWPSLLSRWTWSINNQNQADSITSNVQNGLTVSSATILPSVTNPGSTFRWISTWAVHWNTNTLQDPSIKQTNLRKFPQTATYFDQAARHTEWMGWCRSVRGLSFPHQRPQTPAEWGWGKGTQVFGPLTPAKNYRHYRAACNYINMIREDYV